MAFSFELGLVISVGPYGAISAGPEHRKNWLFANTTAGARSSAVIYSLIETAKENGLDPYCYLLWVLHTASELAGQDSVWAENVTPSLAPDTCKIPE